MHVETRAMRSYYNALGIPPQVNAFVSNLRQNFSDVQIQVGIPTHSNVFEERGSNHLMIPANILQKMTKDKEYTENFKKDLQTMKQQMLLDGDNPSIQSSGFFINLDGSYGSWVIAHNLSPNGSTDVLRRLQQEKQHSLNQNPEASKAQHRIFSKEIIIDKGHLYEKEQGINHDTIHPTLSFDWHVSL